MNKKAYTSPKIKTLSFDAEELLNVSGQQNVEMNKGNSRRVIHDDDDIGAKSSNASDGWDDWEEE